MENVTNKVMEFMNRHGYAARFLHNAPLSERMNDVMTLASQCVYEVAENFEEPHVIKARRYAFSAFWGVLSIMQDVEISFSDLFKNEEDSEEGDDILMMLYEEQDVNDAEEKFAALTVIHSELCMFGMLFNKWERVQMIVPDTHNELDPQAYFAFVVLSLIALLSVFVPKEEFRIMILEG